ncbi:MAG: methyltransferase domain-containing protein [Syntrophobacterales bacterium]|jgi:SAM-dependent methyltransferase
MTEILFKYPLLYRFKHFLIERVIWRWLLFWLPLNPMPDISDFIRGKRLLLAACGPGGVSTGPPIDAASYIFAFDISQAFVISCKHNHPNWHICCGDALHIPCQSEAFDVVVQYSALHHIPADASVVLAELKRVSNKFIIIVEGIVPERGWLRRALLAWYAAVDGGIHYYTHAELDSCFRKLGLRVELADRYSPIRHVLLAVLSRT